MTVSRLIRSACFAGGLALLLAPYLKADAGLFDDPSVISFTIDAPLQQLFDRSDKDDAFSVPARLQSGGTTSSDDVLDGELSVRGNTSRKECTFPKLKL
jgi:hypothetical protein